MSKHTIYLVISLLIGLALACGQGAQLPPAPTAPSVPTVPVLADTATAPPVPPTDTPEPLPPTERPPLSDGLTCTLEGEFYHCGDGTLQIEFEYPASWGPLSAELRPGGNSGSAYTYNLADPVPPHLAAYQFGGRSLDFSEGRGGMLSDFFGYDQTPSSARCAAVADYFPTCREVQPDVVIITVVPDAASFCSEFPAVIFWPLVFVEINLPDNPTINGFIFVVPFLSAEGYTQFEADLQQTLGYSFTTGLANCTDQAMADFDARMQTLLAGAQARTLDAASNTHLDQLDHLAESVIFR